MTELLLIEYFGLALPWCRAYIYLLGALKASMGYTWCTLKPNPFTYTDFFSFKDGRKAPERYSNQAAVEFNASIGLRRRLITDRDSVAWVTKYLPLLFPAI